MPAVAPGAVAMVVDAVLIRAGNEWLDVCSSGSFLGLAGPVEGGGIEHAVTRPTR